MPGRSGPITVTTIATWLAGASSFNTTALRSSGALVAKRIQPRKLLFAVSIVLIATSMFSLYKALS